MVLKITNMCAGGIAKKNHQRFRRLWGGGGKGQAKLYSAPLMGS